MTSEEHILIPPNIAMHGIWSDRCLLFLKHVQDVRTFPDPAWYESTEERDVRI